MLRKSSGSEHQGTDQHPQTLMLSTSLLSKHAQQDRALTQTDRKIETEVAGLKTLLEAHKLDTIKYLAGELLYTEAFKTAGKNEVSIIDQSGAGSSCR